MDIMNIFQFSSRKSGPNSGTMCVLYIYFRLNLIEAEFEGDNIGRQFRARLVSSSEGGVRNTTLNNTAYVLALNNQPSPAANVGKFFRNMVSSLK